MAAPLTKLGSWFEQSRDAYLLGLLRVLLSALFAASSLKLLSAALRGPYFAEFFYLPLLPEPLVPSRSAYLGLLALQLAASVLSMVGLFARESLLSAASIGFYLLAANRLDYHNNRYVLCLLGFLLAFAPCDRSFSLARQRAADNARIGPVWAQRLIQLQISLVYLASGGSKLLDPDWRTGQVLHLRFENGVALAAAAGKTLPTSIATLLNSPVLAEFSAKAAICTELFLAVGLWLPRTRAVALWLGVLFHLGIEISARVELFSLVIWAGYLSFCIPELAERRLSYDPERVFARRLARIVARLDWLRRFEIRAQSPAPTMPWGIEAIDRDGRAYRGFAALSLMTRALPLLFPLWLPVALLERMLRRRTRTQSSVGLDPSSA